MTQEAVAQNIKNQLTSNSGNEKVEERKRKPMHWQLYRDLERPSADKRSPWCGYVAQALGRTGSVMTAAQDQALNMRYYKRSIMKQPTDSKCRMCYKAEERTMHIVVGCTILALYEYNNRHNKVAGYIHYKICKHTALQITDK